MNIFCLGVSHHTASVQLRECLSLEGQQLQARLISFRQRREQFAPISELAILSTCTRLEIYASTFQVPGTYQDLDACFAPLLRFVGEISGLRGQKLEPYIYKLSGEQVIRHLSRVAASLDSLVLGDPQILGQVSNAHQVALAAGSTRHVISALFRSAIHAGKRVRSETAIGRHPTNMSAVALRLVEEKLGKLPGRSGMVVGTGEIGQQSLEALHQEGLADLFIASRSSERSHSFAQTWSAQPVTFDQLPQALAKVDFVISSTTSLKPVIERSQVEQALAARAGRPALVLVDLGLPRNIDPAVRDLPGVILYDLDDIQAYIENAHGRRLSEVPRAEQIVQEETAAFSRWLAVMPVVGELHRRAESIRQQEVERTLHHLPDLDPKVLEQIEILSQSLVRKILHEPTAQLRNEAEGDNLEKYVEMINSLFKLTEQVNIPPSSVPDAMLTQTKGEIL
jgi:glutamyl-tRNA reductase